MSTLRCDNFGPSAGGTTYSARGIAKAWVNFNGTGTIATRDSLNLSSLTDNGTGDYTVNFSNAFGAADYAAVNSDSASGAGEIGGATGNIVVRCRNSSGVLNDANVVTVTCHGDLA